jgi:Fe-S oxidoreductase
MILTTLQMKAREARGNHRMGFCEEVCPTSRTTALLSPTKDELCARRVVRAKLGANCDNKTV